MEQFISIINSPAFIAAIAIVVVYLLNRLYAKKPTWAKFQGTIISGIKAAEKAIKDDTENKALAKLDYALKYTLKVFEDVEGRQATQAEEQEIKEAISEKHDTLEANGTLKSGE